MAKQSGYLIMVVAVLLVVVAGLGTAYVSMSVSSGRATSSIVSANHAYDLASTAVEQGSYQLLLGSCNSSWSSAVVVSGQGEYQYNCTQYSAGTTTTSALTNVATTIPLSTTANFASFGAITIDSEVIYYDGISGNNLLNARRGQNGTTAAGHLINATVSQAQYIIVGQGGTPSLSRLEGSVTLQQVVYLNYSSNYYAVGTNGSNGVILYYNGSTWSTVLTAASGFTFYHADMTSTYGQAVGHNTSNQSAIYAFNGSTWSVIASGLSMNLEVVGCDSPTSPTNCWAGGQAVSPGRGLLYRGGTTYTASNNFMLTGLSCTGGNCMAVRNNSSYPFVSTSISPFTTNLSLATTINDVDCAQANRCVAVRSNGSVYYYNGAWSGAISLSGVALTSVNCPSAGNCMVAGNSGRIYNCSLPITSSASCALQSTPGSLNILDIFCNSTSDCLAVGAGTTAYRYNGSSWVTVTLPASYTLRGVTGYMGGAASVIPIILRNQ
ncbi:hypothetical protein [Legionella waltersii]|uniref:Uncharacterized protein n=1 Tax=Legionella waltersii TaxID=66969 RepID=A0A0W1AMU7_9GAMM|nr:hypothetical protein [Legionella waltersii]KTD82576.1 hypothetical protein Lwal_0505 [Legionella waltersii]SNV02492.1 Uncharacterised protein [Legionella waltersii]